MQSIRQYREIGRYVEHTHHEEDNRSKEKPDVVKKPGPPSLSLPLPNLGPDIERQWKSDVEGQLQGYSSSCASIRSEKSSYYSVNDDKSKQEDADSIRSLSDSDKSKQQDSGYASTNEKATVQVTQSSTTTSSDVSSEDFEPTAIRLSALRPKSTARPKSTESIISHFSRHSTGHAIAQSHFFETPRTAPVPPEEEPEKIIPVHSVGPSDPTNPRHWPLKHRMAAFWIVAWLSFTQTWAGSADSSYTGAAAAALGVSKVAASLNTAGFSIGIAVGSLFVGPLSETFGRFWCFFIAGFLYLMSVMGTALSRDLVGQVVSRLFVGLFSSVTGAVSGSVMHDVFDAKERSIMYPILALMNTLPTALAPIPGGWIVEYGKSFYWADWITFGISVPVWLAAVFFLPETYSPLLQSWKAEHLRRVTGDPRYRSGLETGGGLGSRLKETLPRPVIFWVREPVIIILGIYTVVLNVLLFVFLSAFEFIFADTYGFSSGQTTLVFLSIGAGTIFSTMLTPIWYKLDVKALHKRQIIDGPDAPFPPESRLWPCMIASPFFAICIFWLGWTNYPSISPWSGIGACFVFGYALISIQISSFQYIIDSYGPYAASALGGVTVARYGFAAGLNVASRPMFETLGVHWTLTMIGTIAVVLIPAPWIFYKYGAKVRARSRYANYA
ncbi:putative major facilitator superfamily protein [Lasiodiplodia theobromae]|nr:putative major facilitator superfamily protein [Lasiodiplodia theobromae]